MINASPNLLFLRELREIARLTCYLQFSASTVYLLCSQVFPLSHVVAVGCGYVAIFIALVPVAYSIFHKKFPLVFSCLCLFNLAPIWFLYFETVLPKYDAYVYSPPVFKLEALFWVGIFQFITNFFYITFGRSLAWQSIRSLHFLQSIRLPPNFYVKITLLSFCLPLIAFYYYYDSSEMLWKALTAGRAQGGSSGGLLIQTTLGGSGSLMLPVSWFWQLTPLFGVIAFVCSKKKSVSAICSLMLGLLVIFSFFLSGSRGITAFVAAPVLFFLAFYNWERGFKFWIIATAIICFFIGVMEIQVRYRGNLLQVLADPSKAAKEYNYESATTFDLTESQRDNNMYLLCLLIKAYPDKYPFEGFDDFFAVLVNPIPRTLWPGKPIRQEADESSSQYGWILNGPLFIGTNSLSYSVVGEAYKAFGLYGITFYSGIYALFLMFFDGVIYYAQKKNELSVALLGLAVFLAFWGFRSLVAFVTFIYPLLLFLVLFWLMYKIKGMVSQRNK